MKVICMIPSRIGSTRIPKKNIRILYDKPLIAWAIEAAIKANCFDEIWVNGDDDIFGEIAKEYGVLFYKRPSILGTDAATNDDFMYDFLQNVECGTVMQLLPTSPFITPKEISDFMDAFEEDDIISCLMSVKEIKIECLYDTKPINFNDNEKTKPSQELKPILAYNCSPIIWERDYYMADYENNNGAYHGRTNEFKYYPMKGYSTIDIDTEEDWMIAERIAEALALNKKTEPQYYVSGLMKGVEADVPSILEKDGVPNNDLFDVNHPVVNLFDIYLGQGNFPSWSKRVIDSPSNSATIITQLKGEGNRLHLHYNWDEWWLILSGQWEFEIEGEKHMVTKDDIVFIERGKRHKITAVSDVASRLAISRADVPHVYVNE